MGDVPHALGHDHPCKETCSGWKQGFERGVSNERGQLERVQRQLALAEREILALRNSITYWKNQEPPDDSVRHEKMADKFRDKRLNDV